MGDWADFGLLKYELGCGCAFVVIAGLMVGLIVGGVVICGVFGR